MTALAATIQPASGTRPPSVLLQVTGAPTPPTTAYTSSFGAGVDGWATSGAGNALTTSTLNGTPSLRLTADPGPGTATRTVTGLVSGQAYRLRLSFLTTSGQTRIGVQGKGTTSWVSGGSIGINGRPATFVVLDYAFTASATSHVLTLEAQRSTASAASVYVNTITVAPTGTWQGTTIYRTDANGTDTVVREDPAGQDTAGGTMTVTDWEAALAGSLAYRVVDGNGVSTAAPVVAFGETRRNYITDPRLVSATGWAGVAAGGALTTSPAYSPNQSATAGETWTTGFDVVNASAADVVVNVAGRPTTGSAFGTLAFVAKVATVPAGSTVRVVHTGALPAGADGLRAYITATATAGVSVANVTLEKGTTTGARLDGTQAGAVWVGAANASQSIAIGEPAGVVPWFTLPATATPSAGSSGAPSAVSAPMVLTYAEESSSIGVMHQVIGRRDKIGNPGALSTRSGDLDVLELDYAGSRALRELLRNGDTALLRQPTHAGLDLYFVATRVRLTPAAAGRWTASVAYEEVPAP